MKPKLSELSPEQKRVLCAESQGWTEIGQRISCASGKQLIGATSYLGGVPPNPDPNMDWEVTSEPLPDYTNDLNAMHKVVKGLIFSKRKAYRENLQRVVSLELSSGRLVAIEECIDAEASQRLDAFLLTIGAAEL